MLGAEISRPCKVFTVQREIHHNAKEKTIQLVFITHRIHVWYIFPPLAVSSLLMVNAGTVKVPYMEPMGYLKPFKSNFTVS